LFLLLLAVCYSIDRANIFCPQKEKWKMLPEYSNQSLDFGFSSAISHFYIAGFISRGGWVGFFSFYKHLKISHRRACKCVWCSLLFVPVNRNYEVWRIMSRDNCRYFLKHWLDIYIAALAFYERRKIDNLVNVFLKLLIEQGEIYKKF